MLLLSGKKGEGESEKKEKYLTLPHLFRLRKKYWSFEGGQNTPALHQRFLNV